MARVPVLEQGEAGRLVSEYMGLPEKEALELAKIAELDRFIGNRAVLWRKAGAELENFVLVADALSAIMAVDPKAPLYKGKPGREEDAGRRCILYPRHMLLLFMERMRQATPQWVIGDAYGISQSSVSRYCEYVESVLVKILPTGDNLADRMSKARTVEQVQSVSNEAMEDLEKLAGAEPGSAGRPGKTLPHNRLIHDGTHIPRQRPKDKGERKDYYSGKKKRHTDNIVCTVNSNGAILWISELMPGSTHDLSVLRTSKQDLGLVTSCLKGESRAMKCDEYGDKGFQGLQDDHHGARVYTPVKRPRNGKLTEKQKRYNKRQGRKRIGVEHTFGACKLFKMIKHAVRRMREKARRTVVLISGMVNLHIFTNSRSKARNHRKGKKPGPKTARSRS